VSLTVSASWSDTSGAIQLQSVSGNLAGKNVSVPGLPVTVQVSDDPTQDLADFVSDFGAGALTRVEDAVLKSPWTFGPTPIFGGRCSYTIQAAWDGSDWTSGTLTGTLTCAKVASLERARAGRTTSPATRTPSR
jgi:hypothetical protein